MIFTKKDLEDLGFYSSCGAKTVEIKEIENDSRLVKTNGAFLAMDGANFSAERFIWDVLQKKKTIVLIDAKHRPAVMKDPRFLPELPIYFSDRFQESLVRFLNQYYDFPHKKLKIVGITGTNGKTSIAYGCYELAKLMKKKSAYCGTLGVFGYKQINTNMTTPDIVILYKFLAECARKKHSYVFLEVSSHGLEQQRVAGIEWDIGVFTNLTQDHLDYHRSMIHYYHAKKKLFEAMEQQNIKKKPYAIINCDDEYGRRLYQELGNRVSLGKSGIQLQALGSSGPAASILEVHQSWNGYRFKISYQNQEYLIQTRFIGLFNVYNIAMMFMVMMQLGFLAKQIIAGLEKLKAPPGRMEVIKLKNNRNAIVDYAHTPDALENVLTTIREMNPIRIILIFGCGGDRDTGKRPLMGKIASRFADFTVITNDNPRNEDPQMIVNQIKSGLESSKYVVTFDREKAIQIGLQILGPQEVLIIAGKGHENYQILKDETIDFEDKKVLLKLAKKMDLLP